MDIRVKIAIDLMEAGFRQGFTIDHLAKTLNLSSSRLRHLFKKETGLSQTQYLNNLKMEMARELLETSFLSIKEIVVEINLKNPSCFARIFKKTYGLPPSAYRALAQKKKLAKSSHTGT